MITVRTIYIYIYIVITTADKEGMEGVLGHSTDDNPNGESQPEIKPEDLEEVAHLYDLIRGLRKRIDPSNDHNLAMDFDNYIKLIMIQLKANLNMPNINIQLRNAYIMKAKYGLYEMCADKMVEYLRETDPEAGDLICNIKDGGSKIMQDLFQGMFQLKPILERELNLYKEEVKSAHKETTQVLEAAEHLENDMQVCCIYIYIYIYI